MPARARNLSPIVPRASIAGRALVAVVAIMTFLASITTGTVLLVSASAAEWQSDVASEITARAIAARCFSPPDRIGGSASIRSPSPTHRSRSMTSLR